MDLESGQQYEVKFPFIIDTYDGYDVDGPFQIETWRPGCRVEDCAPDDAQLVADAEGKMILTIVDIHKPGKYPERVFYTRKWRDPEGKEFGAGKLHITTTPTFKRRAAGYYHAYHLPGKDEASLPI